MRMSKQKKVEEIVAGVKAVQLLARGLNCLTPEGTEVVAKTMIALGWRPRDVLIPLRPTKVAYIHPPNDPTRVSITTRIVWSPSTQTWFAHRIGMATEVGPQPGFCVEFQEDC